MSTLITLPPLRPKPRFNCSLGNFAWSFQQDEREHLKIAQREYIRIVGGLWYCYIDLTKRPTSPNVIPFRPR